MTKVHGPLLNLGWSNWRELGLVMQEVLGRGIFLTNIFRSFQFGRYWVKGYLSWRGELSGR